MAAERTYFHGLRPWEEGTIDRVRRVTSGVYNRATELTWVPSTGAYRAISEDQATRGVRSPTTPLSSNRWQRRGQTSSSHVLLSRRNASLFRKRMKVPLWSRSETSTQALVNSSIGGGAPATPARLSASLEIMASLPAALRLTLSHLTQKTKR